MKRQGFTLIELLIVVAIIAILAAIAVPNFLEAQVRSKISRVKADARSAATALEAYMVDRNDYPPHSVPAGFNYYGCLHLQYASALSTPVAYMTSTMLQDPFAALKTAIDPVQGASTPPDWKPKLYFFLYNSRWAAVCYGDTFKRRGFSVFSNGPIRDKWSGFEHIPYFTYVGFDQMGSGGWCDIYDATNGTRSQGGIGRFGGDLNVPQSP